MNQIFLVQAQLNYMNEARRKKLQADYTGIIEFKSGQFVQIDHVEVQPQPFGAYVGIGEKIAEINQVLIEPKNSSYPAASI